MDFETESGLPQDAQIRKAFDLFSSVMEQRFGDRFPLFDFEGPDSPVMSGRILMEVCDKPPVDLICAGFLVFCGRANGFDWIGTEFNESVCQATVDLASYGVCGSYQDVADNLGTGGASDSVKILQMAKTLVGVRFDMAVLRKDPSAETDYALDPNGHKALASVCRDACPALGKKLGEAIAAIEALRCDPRPVSASEILQPKP